MKVIFIKYLLQALERRRKRQNEQVDKDLKKRKIGENEEVVLIKNSTVDANPFSEKNIERVIDTGAGYLLKSGSKDDKNKVRPRKFFEEKYYEEEPCEGLGFNHRTLKFLKF